MPDLTPGTPDVVAQAPQSKVGGDAFQRTPLVGSNDISPGLQQLGAGLEDLATPLAKIQGEHDAASAVVRNPDGSITLTDHPATPVFGKAGIAYQNAEESAMAATGRTSIEVQYAKMATQYQNDPDGFQKQAGQYADSFAKNYPGEVGLKLQQYAQAIGAQHMVGLVGQKQRTDLSQDNAVIGQRQGQLENTMDGLAAQGLSQSSAYIAAAKERDAILDQKVSNPAFAYNQQMRDLDEGNFQTRMTVATLTGAARDEAAKTGNVGAALQKMDTALRQLPISEDKRIAYEGEVTRHLSAMSAIGAQQRQQLSDQADATVLQAKAHPDSVQPEQLDALSMQLERSKMFAKSAQVQETKIYNSTIAPMIVAGSNADAVNGLHQVYAAAAGGAGGSYLRKLAQQESGNNPNASASTSSAQGLYQFTAGTWNQVRLLHPELGLTQDGRSDPAQQQRAIAAFTTENRQALQASGIAPTDSNTYMAHFLGAGGATTFLKAMQANPGQAAAIVSPAAAAANPKVFYVGGDQSQPRSLSEVYALQTARFGGAGSSTTPVDLSGSQGPMAQRYSLAIKQAQGAYNTKAEQLWTGMETAFGKQEMPTPQEFSDLRAMMPDVTNPDLRRKVSDKLNEVQASEQFGKLPVAQQEDAAASLQLAAQQGQLGNIERRTLDGIVQTKNHMAQLAKDDPVSLGVLKVPPQMAQQAGLPQITPLDPSDPNGFAAGLKARQTWKGIAKQDPSVGDMPLRATDIEQMTQQAPNWNGQQAKVALGGMASTLSQPEMDAVMADKSMKAMVMGLAHSGDPDKMNAAFSLLDLQKRRNPLLFDAQDGQANKELTAYQSYLSYMPPAEVAKKMMTFNDPDQIATRDGLRRDAETALKGLTPETAVSRIFGSWVPGMTPGQIASEGAAPNEAGVGGAVMAADYRKAYVDQFEASGSADAAQKYATEKVQNKYSVSGINGGRVMAYAPERYYKPINGSMDWLKDQLSDAVEQTDWAKARHGGEDLATPQVEVPGMLLTAAAQRTPYAYYLLPDDKTQADIAANRPPSYRVLAQGNDGRFDVVSGAGNTAFRFRGDDTAPLAQSAADATAAHKVRMNNMAHADEVLRTGP